MLSTEDKIWLLSIWSALKDGNLPFEQQKQCFEVLCSYPEIFTIGEPIPRGADFVYDIVVNTEKLI